MAENGEEKLLAMARHIAKTLGHNDSMADDILQIFSNFDGRFSREKMSDDDSRDPFADLEHSLKALDSQISHYVASDQPIWSHSADSSGFLHAIDELNDTIRDWSPMASDKTVTTYLVRGEHLMQQAMFRMQEEFGSLMERGGDSFELNQYGRKVSSFDSEEDDEDEEGGGLMANEEDEEIPVAQPITNYDILIDALPSVTINDLHEMAKRMVAAGFVKDCSHVYSSCRREFLEESMSRLGIQKLSIEEVHRMPWQDLDDEIERWTKAANVALRILFPSERRLCDRVFFGLSMASELSFMEVCRGSTLQLLKFADAIAIGSRSPERLFKVLDVFETLRDLMPEIESIFSDHYCLFLRNEALAVWKRLGEAIRGTFTELENLIRRDPAKATVPGGGVHPISRYVMNYLRAACRSRQTLEQIFEENLVIIERRASSTSLSVQMAWIMELLESNLEVKSKLYRDPGLSFIFLMNNGRYIVQKVEDGELGSLLGDDWIRKYIAKLRQYLINYQRSSWNKLLAVLKLDSASARSMKEKIKLFNSQFDEICKAQSTWVIFDEQLKKELRISVAKNLLPAYENFLERCQNVSEFGKHVRYSLEEIDDRVKNLFVGSSGR